MSDDSEKQENNRALTVRRSSEDTRFKPGQSGNPKGYPKGKKNRSTIAKKILEMKGILPSEILSKLQMLFPEIEASMTVEEVMTIVQAGKAITKGDYYSYMALMDSGYGRAAQPVTGKDGKDLYPKNKYEEMSLEELRAERDKRAK